MNGSKQHPRGCLVVVVLAVILVWCGSLGAPAEAATLTWDRNSETDMDHYNVYGCFTQGCTVAQTSAMKQSGTVLQTAVGVAPSVAVTITGKAGAYAVSAADASGNESGLSVQVPFDAAPPIVPVNPRLNP